MVSLGDIVRAASRPLLSGIVATVIASGVQFSYGSSFSPLTRLALGGAVLLGAYLGMLLYVMGQKAFYLDLFQGLRRRPAVEEKLQLKPQPQPVGAE
jgi:PST family polysaccharide transporter